MALKKKPVTGMKDMMPDEMEIRDYVIHLIKETYQDISDLPRWRHHVWSILRTCAASRAEIMRS